MTPWWSSPPCPRIGRVGKSAPRRSRSIGSDLVPWLCTSLCTCVPEVAAPHSHLVPPPRCASWNEKRPRSRLPGLQRQSFNTPPPQRVTGVLNRSCGAGPDETTWRSGAASAEIPASPSVLQERHGDSHPQSSRERRMKEGVIAGFLEVKKEGEERTMQAAEEKGVVVIEWLPAPGDVSPRAVIPSHAWTIR